MKQYSITHPNWEGGITVGFSAEGLLVLVDASQTNIGLEAMHRLLEKIPRQHSQFFTPWSTLARVAPIDQEITFQMFWDQVCSGNKKNVHLCKPEFAKLSQPNKLLAYTRMKPYERYCDRNQNGVMANPVTWLKKQYFLTDWTTLK